MGDKNKNQKIIAQVLGTRLLSFNPDLARALCSIKASIFLNQLLFWWGKGHKQGVIYKTIKEMEKETYLSRAEQDEAIKICKKHELIEVILRGIPAKRHFKINLEKIIAFLQLSLPKTDKLDSHNLAKHDVGSKQTNTERTTKITNREPYFTNRGSKGFSTLTPEDFRILDEIIKLDGPKTDKN